QLGFATIWYQWKNLLITPFYWLMAPGYRRSGRTTVAEVIEDRYGRDMALLYTLFALAFFIFNQGCMLKGAAKVISIATGGEAISPNGVVVAMTVAFILYSFYGGLKSSAYTDFVQGFMIIVLSFMLIPAGLRVVGGFAGMRHSLPPEFFDLYNQNSGMDAFTITMLAINGLVGITAMPHTLSMNATGATERAGRVGQTYGAVVKRFCAIGWAFTGLIVAAMLLQRGQTLEDKELAFGFACRELLGSGLTGLMVACVLAANMSTCSNFMVNSGALFTRNLYGEYINPAADDRRLLQVGRMSGLALTILGIGFALMVDQVLDAFLFTETIAALMGVMFLGGFLWPRANRWGAAASLAGSGIVYYACNYLMTCHHGSELFKTLGDAWASFVASAGH
ncbi:MAG: sodium:solute symporter family protein, partial [Acidobacteriota bacterium]